VILKRDILTDLQNLDRLHSASLLAGPHPLASTHYAKLAIVEYCGWIEEALDTIAKRAVRGKLRSHRELDDCIRKNHGFDFDDNFLKMMRQIVGLSACEELLDGLQSDGSDAVIRAEFNKLKIRRNNAAHVYSRTPVTTAYDAPSVLIGSLNTVYPIIKRLYSWSVRHRI
jgi:hypothetical protein